MFDEALFREAIAQPRLRQPLPQYLPGNRAGGKVKVLNEPELNAMTEQWFVDLDRKIAHYADRGIDVAFAAEWAKKYWWSWLMRDMSLNHELYTPDLRYKDPTTFGRIIVGLEEFERYNFSFLDAIPDWRYDPLPGQIYFDVTPEGETRVVVRYIGSGHFSGTLRFYPYDESAPAIHGVGTFVQCTAVDRYHFNTDGLMYEGETLFDLLDATQSAGVLPSDDSWLFRALMSASRLPRLVQNARRTLRLT
ncbi:nuclear transport factor 2 family protein [Mycolicibacter arupensis]|uniref:nuclear transport factor 2 family protein n=1 Tax=Mycolicibacter arupensis TaxID=342002 RepID=UPI003B3B4B72